MRKLSAPLQYRGSLLIDDPEIRTEQAFYDYIMDRLEDLIKTDTITEYKHKLTIKFSCNTLREHGFVLYYVSQALREAGWLHNFEYDPEICDKLVIKIWKKIFPPFDIMEERAKNSLRELGALPGQVK